MQTSVPGVSMEPSSAIIDSKLSEIRRFLIMDLVGSLSGRDGLFEPQEDWQLIIKNLAEIRAIDHQLPISQKAILDELTSDLEQNLNGVVSILREGMERGGHGSTAEPEIIERVDLATLKVREDFERSARVFYEVQRSRPTSGHEVQASRLLNLNRRVYQTHFIVSKRTRSVRLRTKILNFLGIAIPLVGGGIIMAFYANQKVPDLILIVTGACALAQVVMSLWSLSDEWDRKGKLNETTLVQFSELRGELGQLRPNHTGVYDEQQLLDFERRSAVGLSYDDALGVTEGERNKGWAAALTRFPDP